MRPALPFTTHGGHTGMQIRKERIIKYVHYGRVQLPNFVDKTRQI
jgi:hypothetical protein